MTATSPAFRGGERTMSIYMRPPSVLLPAAMLPEFLKYNPGTGILTWAVERQPQRPAGSIAGSVGCDGYIQVCISSQRYKAHRIAWAMHHGEWPTSIIDHINGVKTDNRIDNLRTASHSQNLSNFGVPSHNKTGIKGVSWDRTNNKWRSCISVNGKTINLGRFSSIDEAARAYAAAQQRFKGEFGRVA